MFEYIEKLRKLPQKKRAQITFGLSAGITLFLAIMWGTFVVPSFFRGPAVLATTDGAEETLTTAPFSAIKSNFAGVYSAFSGQLKEIFNESSASSTPTTTPSEAYSGTSTSKSLSTTTLSNSTSTQTLSATSSSENNKSEENSSSKVGTLKIH